MKSLHLPTIVVLVVIILLAFIVYHKVVRGE